MRYILRQLKRRARFVREDIQYRNRVAELKNAAALNEQSREVIINGAVRFALSVFDSDAGGFKFTRDSTTRDLYSTAYGVSILGLTGHLHDLDRTDIDRIGNFIVENQSDDGLFRDPSLKSPNAETGHGWGWRHLLPHIIIALDYLGLCPRKEFRYLFDFFSKNSHIPWVTQLFSEDKLIASNNFMNTVVGFQYARDFMDANKYEQTVCDLLEYIVSNEIPRCISITNKNLRMSVSECVKTIYHLLPSIIYERDLSPSLSDSIVDLAMATEHKVAGFGTTCTSDACEDMDSVYILATMPGVREDMRRIEVLKKALLSLMINRNSDGGFVFKRFVPFVYGQCNALSSNADQSNLFGTWFRLLTYSFADRALSGQDSPWTFSSVPGYQYFPLG